MADTAGWDSSTNAGTTGSESIYPAEMAGLGATDPDKFPIDPAGVDAELCYQPKLKPSYFPATIQEIREAAPAVTVIRQNPLLVRSNP